MKRLFVLAALLAIVCYGKAQNVQLHYDFGGALYDKDLHGRPVLTSTVEMFKADKWGSTYFFVDMDYTSKGVAAGYWEIARELRFWQPPFSIHVEYNGEHRTVSPIITPILAVQPIPGIIRILRKVSRLPLCINISKNIGNPTTSS